MNSSKCNDLDYINFLIASQEAFTCTKEARCQKGSHHTPLVPYKPIWLSLSMNSSQLS